MGNDRTASKLLIRLSKNDQFGSCTLDMIFTPFSRHIFESEAGLYNRIDAVAAVIIMVMIE
jgi:hypothetical protein